MAETETCLYCGESIELAGDGAWQGAEDGACGCTASSEQGGAGEHEPGEELRPRRERRERMK